MEMLASWVTVRGSSGQISDPIVLAIARPCCSLSLCYYFVNDQTAVLSMWIPTVHVGGISGAASFLDLKHVHALGQIGLNHHV